MRRPSVERPTDPLGARLFHDYRAGRGATPETWRRRSGVRLARSIEVAALRAILRQAAREAATAARTPRVPRWPWWW